MLQLPIRTTPPLSFPFPHRLASKREVFESGRRNYSYFTIESDALLLWPGGPKFGKVHSSMNMDDPYLLTSNFPTVKLLLRYLQETGLSPQINRNGHATFWFDVSSKRHTAYYILGNDLGASVGIVCSGIDEEVVANVKRIDRTLYALAQLCNAIR